MTQKFDGEFTSDYFLPLGPSETMGLLSHDLISPTIDELMEEEEDIQS